MKKQFLVIDLNDAYEYYIVDNLDQFISELYEAELLNGESIETVTEWFNENHKVFEVNGELKELN